MIRGVIHENQPLIPIVVAWKESVQELVALLDTGFTGELKVSPATATELGLKISHAEPVGLADEQVITMPAALAQVAMEGQAETVDVLIGEGQPVVGVGLLKRFEYHLTVDFPRDELTLWK